MRRRCSNLFSWCHTGLERMVCITYTCCGDAVDTMRMPGFSKHCCVPCPCAMVCVRYVLSLLIGYARSVYCISDPGYGLGDFVKVPLQSNIFVLSLFFFFYFFHTLLLPSFWTSRGHRCRRFSPHGSCPKFLSCIGFSNYCSSIFHRVLHCIEDFLFFIFYCPRVKGEENAQAHHTSTCFRTRRGDKYLI